MNAIRGRSHNVMKTAHSPHLRFAPLCKEARTPQWPHRATLQEQRHTYIHTHAQTHTHTHMYERTHACTPTSTRTHTHAHTYVRTHTHTHVRTRAHTHTHTHTHTHFDLFHKHLLTPWPSYCSGHAGNLDMYRHDRAQRY